jgi:hypothetical protein
MDYRRYRGDLGVQFALPVETLDLNPQSSLKRDVSDTLLPPFYRGSPQAGGFLIQTVLKPLLYVEILFRHLRESKLYGTKFWKAITTVCRQEHPVL